MGFIFEGFDLAAAATIVDIGRHQPKLISATQPRGHTATWPHGLVDMSPFRQARFSVWHKVTS